MWDRLLCAIDQVESGQVALDFVAGVASVKDASVRVLHIREVPRMARVLPLESPAEAEELVRDAVHKLGMRGVAAEGRSCSALEEHVARRIVHEAQLWECQAMVLGSRRLHGIGGLSVAASGSAFSGCRLSRCSSDPLPRATRSTGHRGSGLTARSQRPQRAGRHAMVRTTAGFVAPDRR